MRFETLTEKVTTTASGFRHLSLKSGRRIFFTDAEREAEDNWSSVVRWMARMAKLAHAGAGTDPDLDAEDYKDMFEHDWWRIERFCDQLEAIATYYRAEAEKHTKTQSKRARIAALRDVRGRTEEEAASYLAKANALEKEL